MKRRHRETGACLDREKLGFVYLAFIVWLYDFSYNQFLCNLVSNSGYCDYARAT